MITVNEAIKQRHSVRSYTDRAIPADIADELRKLIADCNREGGVNMQLVTGEPKAFSGTMAHYGKFSGVSNYIALIGKKGSDVALGYYGAKVVVLAQQLGLNTCWVGLTFSKVPQALNIGEGEKIQAVIAIGYGAVQGVSHKVKTPEQVAPGYAAAPQWFKDGIDTALLAPTAMNQQKFTFTLAEDGSVQSKAGLGFFAKMDLGIVRYFFELGSGRKVM